MEISAINSPKFLRLVIIVLLVINVFLVYSILSKPQSENAYSLDLLDFHIAQLEAKEFRNIQDTLSVSYSQLKENISQMIGNEKTGEYGFYFEDLTTGAWIGVNERKEFIPASLFKMPTIIATVKKIENGDMTLGDNITLKEADIERNFVSGSLSARGVGYNMTVLDALIYVINESDNTALNVITERLTYGELTESYVATSLPWPKFTGKVDDNLVSPKQYMNVFRSLYYSTYLRRTYSQFILSLLVEANFDSAIPAGVDPRAKVANKVGFYNTGSKNFHDCGIVYAPNKPYMICIMSVNTTQGRFNVVARNISKTVYDYVSKNP